MARMKTQTWIAAGALVVVAGLLLAFGQLYEAPVHELGHYVACVAQGKGPAHMHLWSSPPVTTCRHYDAVEMAAGIADALLIWTVFTVIFGRWLARWLATKYPVAFLYVSVFWFVWSFEAIGELSAWARHIHSTRIPT